MTPPPAGYRRLPTLDAASAPRESHRSPVTAVRWVKPPRAGDPGAAAARREERCLHTKEEEEDNLTSGAHVEVRGVSMGCAGPRLAHSASGTNGTGLMRFMEWRSPKHNEVKLLEWSSKVEWSLWSRAGFLEVELSQTDHNETEIH